MFVATVLLDADYCAQQQQRDSGCLGFSLVFDVSNAIIGVFMPFPLKRALAPSALVTPGNSCINQPITNFQMALSKQGAGGGSATYKGPTQAPTAYSTSL